MIELKPLQLLTNAPEVYDYGWAKTLVDNLCITDDGKVLRLVEVEDAWHFSQQIMRYSSGLYTVIDDQSNLEYQLEHDWLQFTDDPQSIFRHTFDFHEIIDSSISEDIEKLLFVIKDFQKNETVSLKPRQGGYYYDLVIKKDQSLFEKIVKEITKLSVKSKE